MGQVILFYVLALINFCLGVGLGFYLGQKMLIVKEGESKIVAQRPFFSKPTTVGKKKPKALSEEMAIKAEERELRE